MHASGTVRQCSAQSLQRGPQARINRQAPNSVAGLQHFLVVWARNLICEMCYMFYAGTSKSRACGSGPMTNRQLEILLVLSPMGPSAQYLGTWDFGNGKSKCNTGFG